MRFRPHSEAVSFDVSVAREARCIRITIRGDASLGRLQSLLQVLEIDSSTWARDAVLIDLRQVQSRYSPDEQSRLAADAAGALRRMKKIALVGPQGRLRESMGVRAFDSDEAARAWFGNGS